MSTQLPTQLHIRDGDEYIHMPTWARFYFDLGYQIGHMQIQDGVYLRLVIVAPVTDYIATFISLGHLIAQTLKPVDLDEHIKRLQLLPDGAKMVRIYEQGWEKQRVEKSQSTNPQYFAMKYLDGRSYTTSRFVVGNELLKIMPVYREDRGVGNNKYSIDFRKEVVCNSLFTTHYSKLINPAIPYTAIIGSIAQQKDELELGCEINGLQFALNELLISNEYMLLQTNLKLVSGQMRSELDYLDANLMIFTDANGIVNHSHDIYNHHHIYVLDYHDNNLESAMGQIQSQYMYRCDVPMPLQNNHQFKAAEISAYFVRRS